MNNQFPSQPPGGMPSGGGNPQTSLEEIKRRISNAQPVVVDNTGQLHTPSPTGNANSADKTVLKPQRWF